MTARTASPSKATIRTATVAVWRASLLLPADERCRISSCLDEGERARVGRFHFPRDRDRFLASRGLLRHILAAYLDLEPADLRFGYTAEGKPFLPEHPSLRFNLSHAADRLVVAVAWDRELGVDVEEMFSEAVMNEVRERVLSPPEQAVFEDLPASERRAWFVRLWTRKEAYIKADGRGMSLPLDRIDVSVRPGRVRHQGDTPADWPLSRRWSIQELAVAPGYAGALAGEGLDWRVAYVDWTSGSSIGAHQPSLRSSASSPEAQGDSSEPPCL